jgi:hypothetical protein
MKRNLTILYSKEPLDINYDTDTIEGYCRKSGICYETTYFFSKVIPAEEIEEQRN